MYTGPVIPKSGLKLIFDPGNIKDLKKDFIYVNTNRVEKETKSLSSELKISKISRNESSIRPSVLIDGSNLSTIGNDSKFHTISFWVKIDDFPYRIHNGVEIRSKRSAITRINYNYDNETNQRNFIEFGAMLPYYKMTENGSTTYPYKTPFKSGNYYDLPISFGAALKIGKKSYSFYTNYTFRMKTWYLLSFEIERSTLFERYERYKQEDKSQKNNNGVASIRQRMSTDFFGRKIKSNKVVYDNNGDKISKSDFIEQKDLGILKMKTGFYVNNEIQPIVISPNIIWAGRDGRRGSPYCLAHPVYKNSLGESLVHKTFLNKSENFIKFFSDDYFKARYEYIDFNDVYNIQMAPIKSDNNQQFSMSSSNLYKLNNNISFGQFNIYNRSFNEKIYQQFKNKYR